MHQIVFNARLVERDYSESTLLHYRSAWYSTTAPRWRAIKRSDCNDLSGYSTCKRRILSREKHRQVEWIGVGDSEGSDAATPIQAGW